jgi:hypothetical protein
MAVMPLATFGCGWRLQTIDVVAVLHQLWAQGLSDETSPARNQNAHTTTFL